ncbi:hypothetical protein NNC19_18575 [Clostridium sp. SHJSY1]|uniref:imm11 family protein n=1 Tax=Clostridium sp. SHJSY1 TaxID=2942483 RepID=UPI0028763F27|nr:DUF1629 domain-containing protein [Clostridium sp. SHJSY1]MDS0527698.1 hypothetical protein [Clostridium sp. SHJSY1]
MNKNVNDFLTFFLKDEDKENFIEEKLSRGNLINEWEGLELIKNDADKPIGDCSHSWTNGSNFLFSERAKEIINENFGEYIQLLPMIYEDKNFYIDNILNTVDCVDLDKSDLKIIMGKYIVDVYKYVLKENAKEFPIFKIYLDGVKVTVDTFVNDEFKKVIEDNNLEGFKFTEVFDFESVE